MNDVAVLGDFDLTFKIGYRELECAENAPVFVWWGTYIVTCADWCAIRSPFVIVDNLDVTTYVIKDTRVKKPIIMNAGSCPVLQSVAESLDKTWFHFGLEKDRIAVAEARDDLGKVCTKAHLLISLAPLQAIRIGEGTNDSK